LGKLLNSGYLSCRRPTVVSKRRIKIYMTKVSGIGKQTPGMTFQLERNVKSVAQRLEKMTMAMMKLKSG
jgi:hypothetical protein